MKKIEINQKLRRTINPNFREVLLDLLTYLSDKGFEVEKIIPRLNNAEYLMLKSDDEESPKNFKYEYGYGNIKETMDVSTQNMGGFYKPLYVVDKENSTIIFVKDLVAVIENNNKEIIKSKIMHELLHLVSSVPLINKDNRYSHITGILNHMYKIEDDEILTGYYAGECSLNEAITELLKSYIMQDIYGDENTKKSNGINSYHLITNLFSLMDLGFEKEDNLDVILDIYMNNKTNELYEKIEDLYKIDKYTTINIFKCLEIIAEKFCYGKLSQKEFLLMISEKIYPLYLAFIDDTLLKMYSEYDEEKLPIVFNNYKENLIKYFSLPILSIFKSYIIKHVDSKIKTILEK